MKVVVVYESMFGNTKTVAEAIAEGLHRAGEVTVGSVDDLSPDEAHEAALIVAGGPTHAHGMARPNAHRSLSESSRQKHPVLPGEESLRRWLDRLPAGHAAVAAFDTRFDKPRILTGSAAKGIARKLRAKGYSVLDMESFFVEGGDGPLADGERERAVAWGTELAGKAAAARQAEVATSRGG